MKYPRVLIVSNNPFSNENNMGKTLSSYFANFPKSNIAQLYFHSGKPANNICNNYYSFSDTDALKSIFLRWRKGSIIEKSDFEKNETESFNYGVYELGKKKKPIVYYARDFVWSLSNFKNNKVLKWAQSFNPDAIFFASGDYSFAYKNALWLSKKLNAKLVTMCVDDFYINCEYKEQFLGKSYYNYFMKSARRCINASYKVLACNDLMTREYTKFFNKRFYTLFTPCDNKRLNIPLDQKCGVSYIGGLALNRQIALNDVGCAVNEISSSRIGNKLSIYSSVPQKEILNFIDASPYLVYRGKAAYSEVSRIIGSSFAVVHVESFERGIAMRTRLSLSTKIAESLCSGTLLIAYGPKNLASMEYLRNNNCAIVADNIEDLKSQIISVLNDDVKYKEIINNAKNLACRNHTYDAATNVIISALA